MIKIAVFGCGWGGELFAEYLEKDLVVVEVIRLHDYPHAPYGALSWLQICELTERAVKPAIGKVEVIVLASCAATVGAINFLREKYPEQRFIGFEPRMMEAFGRFEPKRVMLIASAPVRKSIGYKVEKERLSVSAEILEPDCLEWLRYADQEEMTELRLKKSLERQGIEKKMDVTKQIDAVIIYETSLADMKEAFEKVVGWQAMVVNGFEQVRREVCAAVGLLGMDGSVKNKMRPS